MKILVCNAGSTSLKFKLFDMPQEHLLSEGKIERVGSTEDAIVHYSNHLNGTEITLEKQSVPNYAQGIQRYLDYILDSETGVLESITEVERVGFKTVLAKGFYGIHELTDEVMDAMEDYLIVAPAHNRPYLEVIQEIKNVLPDAKLIGAFETDFHTTIPLHRKIYGVPYEWYEEYGIQRFGYHGASHSYIAEFIKQQESKDEKIISCHLGGSGSINAIEDGKSVDNSFGFSLQTGILHANRTGDIDAYLFPYLLSQGKSVEEITNGLDKQGGLLGISGISNDLRDVEEAADEGNERAKLALEAYVHRIIQYIGAYYMELAGVDHIAFTGGIGENSSTIRNAICNELSHIGVEINDDQNIDNQDGFKIISTPESKVKVWVIPANEELGVARKTFSYT